MARLQKESGDLMSFRLQEITRLKERIIRDESRMDEIINILIERDTSEKSKETDDLILELNSTGIRIERDKVSLAKLKAPSELTVNTFQDREVQRNSISSINHSMNH